MHFWGGCMAIRWDNALNALVPQLGWAVTENTGQPKPEPEPSP